jgi:hypothetical protein
VPLVSAYSCWSRPSKLIAAWFMKDWGYRVFHGPKSKKPCTCPLQALVLPSSGSWYCCWIFTSVPAWSSHFCFQYWLEVSFAEYFAAAEYYFIWSSFHFLEFILLAISAALHFQTPYRHFHSGFQRPAAHFSHWSLANSCARCLSSLIRFPHLSRVRRNSHAEGNLASIPGPH